MDFTINQSCNIMFIIRKFSLREIVFENIENAPFFKNLSKPIIWKTSHWVLLLLYPIWAWNAYFEFLDFFFNLLHLSFNKHLCTPAYFLACSREWSSVHKYVSERPARTMAKKKRKRKSQIFINHIGYNLSDKKSRHLGISLFSKSSTS